MAEFFHPDMVAITATDRERLVGREACLASWANFTRAARIRRWEELEPMIQLYGGHGRGDLLLRDDLRHGPASSWADDMFVFVRENGRWWAVADQFSPYPA